MFSYQKIVGRDNKAVKYKSTPYPQFDAPDLPRNFFCFLIAGVRGSGKTQVCIKLLKLNEQTTLKNPDGTTCKERIIVFCPTIEGNQIYKTLKNLDEEDIYTSYSDEMLVEVLAEIKYEKEQTEKYAIMKKLIKKFKTIKNIDLLEPEELLLLMEHNYEMPEPPTYPNGCITHLIFDDLIGTDAFKTVGKSKLTNTVLNGRHLSVNIYILTQNLKAVPKTIRANSTVMAVFRYGQKKILEDIYEECSDLMDFNSFETMYLNATEEPHSFLLLDHTQKRENRLKKCFDHIIKVNKKKNIKEEKLIEEVVSVEKVEK